MHLGGAGVPPVHLIDDNDGLETKCQRLPRDKPGLGHRPLRRVDEQKNTVHHAKDALNLAAEIGMSGRVHQIDLGIAPPQRGILADYGDAPLPLEWVGVHHALRHLFVGPEHACLPEHLIHQRGLAVIHMRNDRDITN